jgi:hypothetical protein
MLRCVLIADGEVSLRVHEKKTERVNRDRLCFEKGIATRCICLFRMVVATNGDSFPNSINRLGSVAEAECPL